MEIWVEFDGTKWNVWPYTAVVAVGTPITWRFRTNLSTPQIRFSANFLRNSPFRNQGTHFTTTTTPVAGHHAGATGTVTADDPGEYKYEVRAEDVAGQTLGFEDPFLNVTFQP